MKRRPIALLFSLIVTVGWVYLLNDFTNIGSTRIPPIGRLLDPVDGVYRTARNATVSEEQTLVLPGLSAPVTVIRDERGVPHLFAANQDDISRAFGYVTAQDRLFQFDFLQRVPAGRLSEILGPDLLDSDRFLRSTGMAYGAEKTVTWFRENDPETVALYEAFCGGVNHFIDGLEERDLPFEMRLLGYTPTRCTFTTMALLIQFLHYDLSWHSDDVQYSNLAEALGDSTFRALFPEQSEWYVPIIPEKSGFVHFPGDRLVTAATDSLNISELTQPMNTVWEGYIAGKGSNNWAVFGDRAEGGRSILAGDPHLRVTFPSIWYEAHLVTPEMNSYGVTVPGTPIPVIGFTEYMAWTMTNTGSDQIDHYALQLDESGSKYRYDGDWRDLRTTIDTIFVQGHEPVLDTVRFSHHGPILRTSTGTVAVKWTAHEANRSPRALFDFHKAQSLEEFQEALRNLDGPMQNILAADRDGNIAIRSTGFLPIRKSGTAGGLLDGSSPQNEWTGRVPFEELPFSYNPEQGFLTSTNQQPAGPAYPHYQRITWRDSFRSLRADTLLRKKNVHSARDLMAYHADVTPVQWPILKNALRQTGVTERSLVTGEARTLFRILADWNGVTDVNASAPLVLETFLDNLRLMMWDELGLDPFKMDTNPPDAPVRSVGLPADSRIFSLLNSDPGSDWFDMQRTPLKEDAHDLLLAVFEATVDTLGSKYGWGETNWRWGDHHKIRFNHMLNSPVFSAFGRGPFDFPGFRHTLSPAASHMTTHTASWRMVVDFSTGFPTAYGVFPGGPSGNPFSPFYAVNLDRYLAFEYFPLYLHRSIDDTERDAGQSSRWLFRSE